jgi:hypothetical protein
MTSVVRRAGSMFWTGDRAAPQSGSVSGPSADASGWWPPTVRTLQLDESSCAGTIAQRPGPGRGRSPGPRRGPPPRAPRVAVSAASVSAVASIAPRRQAAASSAAVTSSVGSNSPAISA